MDSTCLDRDERTGATLVKYLRSYIDSSTAPGLTIVPHSDIFDNPEDLPTFNANAIGRLIDFLGLLIEEVHLDQIPGLAPCFVFLNDDMFFGVPVRISAVTRR